MIRVTEWKVPTDQELDQVLSRLGNEQHRRYFYERLENPRWLRRLHERHRLFGAPPQPWTDSQGETRLPRWPEGDYLARMATNEPELAVEIVTKAKPTTNSLVHRTFLEVALAIPPAQSARLVPLARKWLESPSKDWLGSHRLAEWAAHVARGGDAGTALKLARMLVEVRRGETPTTPVRDTRARGGVTTWLDSYDYADALRTMLPDLIAAGGLAALELVNNQLETWLRHGGQGIVDSLRDYSWLWRPSIASHEQNMGNTIEDALIDAARDAARLVAERDDVQPADVVAALERRQWTVFRRLEFNFLADLVSESQDRESAAFTLARQRVLDAGNLNDYSLVHEYSAITRAVLPLLDEAETAAWTSLIEQGPIIDEADLRERLAPDPQAGNDVDAADGDARAVEPTLDERVDLYREVWRRDRLGAVREALPPPLQDRYAELARRFGEAQNSDFATYTSAMWVGPSSPSTQQEILELNVDDLILFLQHWRPGPRTWPPGPSIDGLTQELQAAVTSDPRHFAERAEDFAPCGRSFVKAILQGLEGALRGGLSFPWASVVRLCAAVASQVVDDTEADAGVHEEDPSWRWAQRAAASLLLQGLQPTAEELPRSLGEQVLTVLAQLVESPEPTPDDDRQGYGSDGEDPVTVALNSTRGQALRGLIAYAAWQLRQEGTQPQEPPDASGESTPARQAESGPEAGLASVPDILDRHLDPTADPSPAVRSVYGQHYPQLLHIMPEWARSRAVRIFGSDTPLDRQQHAAGVAFLAFNQPAPRLLDALSTQYSAWVNAAAAGDFDEKPLYGFESIAGRLAAHLLLLYSWGRIDLETGLLADFFETAPAKVRADGLSHFGWLLWRSKGTIPDDVLARLQTLWERRRQALVEAIEAGAPVEEAGTSPTAELTAFGWWFRSERFDRRWALDELLVVLRYTADVESLDVDLTEQVVQAAHTDLDAALDAYDLLLRSARQGWRLTEVVREGYDLLAAALNSGRPQLVEHATRLIDEIASWGFLDTRGNVEAASNRARDEDQAQGG